MDLSGVMALDGFGEFVQELDEMCGGFAGELGL